MLCRGCGIFHRKNTWKCNYCGKEMNGGVVFITGISGSGTDEHIKRVLDESKKCKKDHSFIYFDVGNSMKEYAEMHDPDVNWDQILDTDEKTLRFLRALAFQQLSYEIKSNLDKLFIVDLHLCFRWKAYLSRGFAPHILEGFKPHVRCFINIIEDLSRVQQRLSQTSWGERKILELLIWRDEELFLTNLYAAICGRVDCLAVANREPPCTIEKIIWHPEFKKIYLSFPITNLQNDPDAVKEIESFRDKIREFLVVFDPYACRDYDETYKRKEMKAYRKEVGEATVERDYRFINQSDAIVVYFPRNVSSKGVDAEMNHARKTGKPIYLYSPKAPAGGPFAVEPEHFKTDSNELIELLKKELST